jgi:threonine/homoserine/homoserine lactone efflux protein
MPDGSTLVLYCGAVLALLVIPGPSVLYIVTRSVDQGRRAGLVSVAGIHVGTVVHVAAATFGISALVARSATAFTVVKLAGAAYLIAVGVVRILRRSPTAEVDATPRSLRTVFLQGVVVNVLNPKTALFFLAFLPQFVDPDRGPVALQTAFLGVVFIVLGVLSDGAYALAAGSARRWLRVDRRVAGTVYVGLGMAAATSGSRL